MAETKHTPTLRKGKGWRVVYGETMPAWEKIFPTKREAADFARKQKSIGDIVFSISMVVPGEPPKSITAAVAKAKSPH
jgi:hypothetical protein